MFFKIHRVDFTARFIAAILLFLLVIFISAAVIAAASSVANDTILKQAEGDSLTTKQNIQIENLISTPLTFPDIEYKTFYDIELSQTFLFEVQAKINQLTLAVKTSKYTPLAIEMMGQELRRLQSISSAVTSDIDKYQKWEDEYYYATKAWEFFMQRGYSEVIASAIIGNMMIETSGGTLKLNPTIYDPPREYYGLCQWSLHYKPFMADMSFEDQLDYLDSDMEKEFKTFGFLFKKAFTYEDFLSMTDPAEAALAFAKVYERCASRGYNARMQAAIIAYDYFTL